MSAAVGFGASVSDMNEGDLEGIVHISSGIEWCGIDSARFSRRVLSVSTAVLWYNVAFARCNQRKGSALLARMDFDAVPPSQDLVHRKIDVLLWQSRSVDCLL